jgi:hypothetical protein
MPEFFKANSSVLDNGGGEEINTSAGTKPKEVKADKERGENFTLCTEDVASKFSRLNDMMKSQTGRTKK